LIDVIVSESTDPSAVLRQTHERLLSTLDIQNNIMFIIPNDDVPTLQHNPFLIKRTYSPISFFVIDIYLTAGREHVRTEHLSIILNQIIRQ